MGKMKCTSVTQHANGTGYAEFQSSTAARASRSGVRTRHHRRYLDVPLPRASKGNPWPRPGVVYTVTLEESARADSR